MTYLLLAVHDLSDKVHRTVTDWREVQLTFDGQYVVDIDLALHGPCQLAPAHCDWLLSVGELLRRDVV
jgi:hypothetical protein